MTTPGCLLARGTRAGNAALSRMFGSPDASRAIADQAQQLSGISSAILKKLLPVIAGILISGLARSGSGKAAPSAPQTSPEQGGGLIDILRQIFDQGQRSHLVTTAEPYSADHGILGPERGARVSKPRQAPVPGGQPRPAPTDTGG